MPGSMMSSTIASNGCSCASQSPSLPSKASSTAKCSASSPRRRVSASGRSSSTSSIRIRPSQCPAVQVLTAQLGPGGDAELGEDVVEVIGDSPGAQEQLRADLPVGQPLRGAVGDLALLGGELPHGARVPPAGDRKSTRLNSSHPSISYAVFC